MKHIICGTLIVLAAATALLSPSTLRAQELPTTLSEDSTPIPPIQKRGTQEMLKLMTGGTSDGKRPIVILDGVRADDKALLNLVAALYSEQVLIGPKGVQVFAGDSNEAAKYGAKAGDRVIIVSTTKPGSNPNPGGGGE